MALADDEIKQGGFRRGLGVAMQVQPGMDGRLAAAHTLFASPVSRPGGSGLLLAVRRHGGGKLHQMTARFPIALARLHQFIHVEVRLKGVSPRLHPAPGHGPPGPLLPRCQFPSPHGFSSPQRLA